MHKIPVGVLGASGYAGRELCGLIQRHPALTLAYATANSQRGETAQLPLGGTVTFRATAGGVLSRMLGVSGRITKAGAYSLDGGRQSVALRFNGAGGPVVTGLGFEVYQNQPNPWISSTQIGFHLPQAATVTLRVYDETGRTVYTQRGDFAKGYNAFTLDRAEASVLIATGVLYYKVETATDSAVKKMIQVK